MAPLLLVYAAVAAASGLDWPPFRDESRYVAATEDFAEAFPAVRFTLNFSGVGIAVWGLLWKTLESLALLRASVVGAAGLSLLFALDLARRWRPESPGRAVLLLGLLPQVFVYAFQINGSMFAILFSVWSLSAYTRWNATPPAAGSRRRLLAGQFGLAALLACIQYPFCAAYPLAALVLEGLRARRDSARRRPAVPLLAASAAALFVYAAFVLLVPEPDVEASMAKHSWSGVNPSVAGLHFGNWVVLLAYLGGMFPFLGLGAGRGAPRAVVVPAVIGAMGLCWLVLPEGYGYHEGFHTIFTSTADHFITAGAVPAWMGTALILGLAGLGAFNAVLLVGSRERGFPSTLALTAAAIYMSLILVDGYVSSRLMLPGLIGVFYGIAGILGRRPRLFLLQIAYQVFWCAAYSLALGSKWGFLGL